MSRGVGEFEPIQDQIPEWLAVVVALLTQLGDIWFLAVLLAALYWFGAAERDGIAAVAGLWLAGMGLYRGLKEIFGLPRPDRPLLDPEVLPGIVRPVYEAAAFAGGYGFPSGHAVSTTIVYFGLAYVLAFGTLRRRVAGAAAIVATVSFTRVALGVHYLVDVVAGVAVAAALLLVAKVLLARLPADRPSIAFGLAIALGLFFTVASDVHPHALIVLAASLGAFAGWQSIVLGRRLASSARSSESSRSVLVRGGAAAVTAVLLIAALADLSLASPVARSGLIGLATAGLIAAPAVRRSDRVRSTAARIRHRLDPGTRRG